MTDQARAEAEAYATEHWSRYHSDAGYGLAIAAHLAGHATGRAKMVWKIERLRDQVRSRYFKHDDEYIIDAITDALDAAPEQEGE